MIVSTQSAAFKRIIFPKQSVLEKILLPIDVCRISGHCKSPISGQGWRQGNLLIEFASPGGNAALKIRNFI